MTNDFLKNESYVEFCIKLLLVELNLGIMKLPKIDGIKTNIIIRFHVRMTLVFRACFRQKLLFDMANDFLKMTVI